jgi:hypothetical protein
MFWFLIDPPPPGGFVVALPATGLVESRRSLQDAEARRTDDRFAHEERVPLIDSAHHAGSVFFRR